MLILSTSARADSTYISPYRTYLEVSDTLFAGINKSTLPFPNLYDRVFPIADLPGFDPAKDTVDYAYISQAFSEVERSYYFYANQSASILNHTIIDDYSYATE